MEINIIGNVSLYDMMLYFFIYGFLGWGAEVVYATLKTGKFVNRGFLNGPFCPIYGVGMAVCVLLLNQIAEKWYLLLIIGSLFATLLEFITGFILEKIFKTKWWDYSNEPFNLKGYVCLKFSLLWGIAILLMFNTLVPLTNKLIGIINFMYFGLILLIIFWSILILDLVSTIIQLKGFNRSLKEVRIFGERIKESSNKVGEKISDATIIIAEKLGKVNAKIKASRIGKAFPMLLKKGEELKNKMGEKIEELKNKKDKD